MRRMLLAAGGILTLGLVLLVGWDFLALGRRVPQLTDQASRATAIIIDKQARRMSLLRNGDVLKTYTISLGRHPLGHKQQEGDGRTPEGSYAVDFKHPRSRFHLALRISYPNDDDRLTAQRDGVRPGGDIMIHGLPNGLGWLDTLHRGHDWTDGCIAVTNPEIEEIWSLVDIGTAVRIQP